MSVDSCIKSQLLTQMSYISAQALALRCWSFQNAFIEKEPEKKVVVLEL